MSEPIIQIKNVTKTFSDFTALKNITLNFFKGEFVVIAGRNGSGKSVLMSLISHLDEVSEGVIITPQNGVGLIFQDADSQILGETPVEDIAFGLRNQKFSKKEIEQKITDALKATGLYEKRFFSARQLSGGEKRRLAVAGILAMNREIFIFDEPFANLDYPGIKSVCAILKKLKAQGKTVIVLTHELEKILSLADRFVILEKGEIKFSGSTEEGLKLDLSKYGIRNPFFKYQSISDFFWGDE